MKLQLKLTQEQFEALDEYINAVAQEKVDNAFNRDSYSYDERRAAYDALVEEDET